MIFAYARISTHGQNLEGQIDELKKSGYDEIFIDKASGAKTNRPELEKLQDRVRQGDTVKIYRLDRLERSLPHLISLVETFKEKGVDLVSLCDHINTQTASGKLMFHMFSAMADFERNLLVERTQVGLKAARARGRMGGRPKGLAPEAINKAQIALSLYDAGEMSVMDIMKRLGIGSKSTFYKYIRFAKSNQKEEQGALLNKGKRAVV